MRNLARIIPIALLIIALTGLSAQAGIKKVAKRINMISFYGGWSNPTGSYTGLGSDNWSDYGGGPTVNPSINGSDIFEPTYHFGFDYGQIRNHRMLYSVGFRYTRAKIKDSIEIPLSSTPGDIGILPFDNENFKVHLYDLEADFNYFLTDPAATIIAPYVGFGGKAGLMTFATDLVDPESGVKYTNENQLKLTVTVNFGADLKLLEAPSGRSYFALSSINSWDVMSSGNRPRYLNIGGAIKYYFRP